MTATNGAPPAPPGVLRRLESDSATVLADLNGRFEDLQTVLRCCERLMTEFGEGSDPAADDEAAGDSQPTGPIDEVLVEAAWTVALLSYARCFNGGSSETEAALTEDDLVATKLSDDILEWHRVLLQVRDHFADPSTNPRERFSAVVSQDLSGAASGIGITSLRQPLVDSYTVRQTGAIAYALSRLVNDRIAAQQEKVFDELKDAPKADLDKLVQLDVAARE